MKIRITGTKEELTAISARLQQMATQPQIRSLSVSGLYANRNAINVYRLYVDLEVVPGKMPAIVDVEA